MTNRPCLVCGEPSAESRCSLHRLPARTKRPTGERGYGWTWQQLSRRARAAQPFCTDCGARDDLQTDHSPEAWRRRAAGKVIRLRDVAVVCGPCNRRRGRSRPTGDTPRVGRPAPRSKAEFRSHTPGGYR